MFEGPANNVATPNCGADGALCCGGGFAAENARWQHARQCRRRAGKWGSTHARQRSGCVNALTLRPHLRLRTCAVSCRDTGGGEAAQQAIPFNISQLKLSGIRLSRTLARHCHLARQHVLALGRRALRGHGRGQAGAGPRCVWLRGCMLRARHVRARGAVSQS